jgi:predicted RNA-binding Zn-ribbon protein involved in translation (DUF1610 family)
MNYNDVGKLDNGNKKPVITTVSCDTSWFDSPKSNPYGDCIGESYTERINKGAIGYLGSVRTTVGALTQSYYPYAPGLQEDFVRQINLDNLELGNTFVDAMAHYAQSWGHMFASSNKGEEQACWLEYHLLGEPELTLWVDSPKFFTVEDETIGDYITITVKDDQGTVVENARVCIWLKDEVYEYQYTDSSGEAKFNVKTNSDDEATLTITYSGFVPYISSVQLLDQIPPITAYKISPSEPDGMNGWYVTSPSINLTVNEDNTITYYKWDNTPTMSEFSSPITAPEGAHTLHFYSVDSSDNTELSQSFSLKLDTTDPDTEMTCDPAEPDGENGWYISVPEIILEKESKATSYYHWDSNPFTIYELPINGLVGKHTLYYYSRDDAGHVEPTNKLELKIDLDTPSTTISLDPELPDGDHNWYASKPYITLKVDETHNYDTYYYWDDDSENSILYEGTFQADLEGEHTINYFTADEAGNTESEKWLNVDIDTTTPKTTIKFVPETPSGESNWYKGDTVLITLESTEPDAKIYYYWDSESSRTIYSQEISAPEGDHTIYFYSVDDAGNRDSVHKENFKIDTIIPESSYEIETESVPNKNNWYLEMPNVELEMDEDGVIYYYMLTEEQSLDDFDAQQLALMRQTYVAIYPIEGIYTYYFYAEDEAGNVGELDSFTIKMDLFDPVPEFNTDKTMLMEGSWVLFNANRSHDENPITGYKFVFSEDEETAWLDEPVLNHTFDEPGIYDVHLLVKDSSGRVSQPSQSVSITIVEKPEKESNLLMQDVAGGLPMIFVIIIIVMVLIIVIVLFIRNRKAGSDWESDSDDDYDDDYDEDEPVLPPPPGRVIDAEFSGYSSGRPIKSRRSKRLSTPPSPSSKKLPPPPPSVVRIVKKKEKDRREIPDDDEIDWDSDEEDEIIDDDEEDEEIDWEEDDEDKKIKLECPKCNKRFVTTKNRMRKQKNIFCTHCGAKGGL